jgi:glutathione S-transferase
MLTLYYKPNCPYSQYVLGEAELLGLHFNLKDVSSDAHLTEELIIQGGKKQTPFLIDPEKGVKMYESELIVAHLKEHYAESRDSFGGLKIHQSEEVCDTCQ